MQMHGEITWQYDESNGLVEEAEADGQWQNE